MDHYLDALREKMIHETETFLEHHLDEDDRSMGAAPLAQPTYGPRTAGPYPGQTPSEGESTSAHLATVLVSAAGARLCPH